MLITKYTKQKMEVLKDRLPHLYDTLVLHEGKLENLGDIAGLIIEYVLKSGGDPEVFQDADIEKLSTEDEFLID